MYQQQNVELRKALVVMTSQITLLSLTVEEVLNLCVKECCRHDKSLSPDQLVSQINQKIKDSFGKLIPGGPPTDLN